MSTSEIWTLAKEMKWKTDSVGQTPWATIAAQIYMSIKTNPRTPFRQVSKRPTRFALTLWEDTSERGTSV
nr:HTH domain-containing protein [Leptospira fletcheri]